MIALRVSLLSPAILFTIVICYIFIVAQAQNHCKGGTIYGKLSPRQLKIARDVEIAYCRGRQLYGDRPIPRKMMYDFIYNRLRHQESKQCMKEQVTPDDLHMCMYLMYKIIQTWQCFGVIHC